MAGPCSPPLRRLARESNDSPPRTLPPATLWHLRQVDDRIGRIFSSKNLLPAASSCPAARPKRTERRAMTAIERFISSSSLRNDPAGDDAVVVGQPEIAAVVSVRQLLVVESH